MKSIDIISLFKKRDFDFAEYQDRICEIGKVCAMRYDKRGKPFCRNFERGLLLLGVALHYKSKYFLEFGTGRGFVTACVSMAEGIRNICTIDKLKASKTIGTVSSTGVDMSRITFINKNSMKLSDDEVDTCFDLVFIDGEHTEKAVRNDFLFALRHTTNDAIIVFDDYRNKHKGVKKYIKSLDYNKVLIPTDGWVYENRMLSSHGDADKIVDGKEAGSGQVILSKRR